MASRARIYTHDRRRIIALWAREDADALTALYAGTATAEEAQRAARAVRQLADNGQWLACGCIGVEDAPPILFPRRRGDALHLVRATRRADHAQSCPFAATDLTLPGGASDESRAPDHPTELLRPLRRPWPIGLAAPGLDSNAVPTPEADRTIRVDDAPFLSRALASLLHSGGLDVVHAPDVETHFRRVDGRNVPFHVLTRRASYSRLADLGSEPRAGGGTLADVVCLNPSRLRDFLVLERERVDAGGDVRALFLLELADSLDAADGTTYPVLRYKAFGRPAGLRVDGALTFANPNAAPPWWALVRLRLGSRLAWVDATEAHLCPAVSRGVPVPVQSDADRSTFERLLDQLIYWRDKSVDPLVASVHRPLFTTHEGSTRPCHPNFVLRPAGGRRVFLVDPTNNPLAAATHRIAATLPDSPRVLNLPSAADWLRFRGVLTGAMYAAREPRDNATHISG